MPPAAEHLSREGQTSQHEHYAASVNLTKCGARVMKQVRMPTVEGHFAAKYFAEECFHAVISLGIREITVEIERFPLSGVPSSGEEPRGK